MAIYNSNVISDGLNGKLPSGLMTCGDVTMAVCTVKVPAGLANGDVLRLCHLPCNTVVLPHLSGVIGSAGIGSLTVSIGDVVADDSGETDATKYGTVDVNSSWQDFAKPDSTSPVKNGAAGFVTATVQGYVNVPAGEEVTFYVAFLMQS